MRLIILYLLLGTSQIFSQPYLGVSYNNSEPSNSTNLTSIQKITFSGTNISFLLTDNSTVPKALSTITKITFSPTGGENPLPVELTSFTASANGNQVTLLWTTATEVNNYGFEIERTPLIPPFGKGGTQGGWEKIGFVAGSGNSNSVKEYSFTDIPNHSSTRPVLGGIQSFQYRLKQIDNDGKFTYSKEIEVGDLRPSAFDLRQNYPNPFNPSTVISYQVPVDTKVTLKLFDILGKEIAVLVDQEQKAGFYNYQLSTTDYHLSSGVYICKMSSGNYTSSIKMTIMK